MFVSSMHAHPDGAIRVFAESVPLNKERMEYCGDWDEQWVEKQEKGSKGNVQRESFDATSLDKWSNVISD